MIGMVGLLKWCGSHHFLVALCVLDVCFIAYDLGSKHQLFTHSHEGVLLRTREVQEETEALREENLNLYRRITLMRHRKEERIKNLTNEMDRIEAILLELANNSEVGAKSQLPS